MYYSVFGPTKNKIVYRKDNEIGPVFFLYYSTPLISFRIHIFFFIRSQTKIIRFPPTKSTLKLNERKKKKTHTNNAEFFEEATYGKILIEENVLICVNVFGNKRNNKYSFQDAGYLWPHNLATFPTVYLSIYLASALSHPPPLSLSFFLYFSFPHSGYIYIYF